MNVSRIQESDLWGSIRACWDMGTGAVGGVQGVLVAAGQAAGGRPVGVHLPVCLTPPPICRGINYFTDTLGTLNRALHIW